MLIRGPNAEKPSVKGFLKNILGFTGSDKSPTTKEPTPPQTPPNLAQPSTPAPTPELPAPKRFIPTSEAYLQRNKGRKDQRESYGDIERIIAYIQGRGEATPGQIAQDLGMARSTLAYHLKFLQSFSPGIRVRKLSLTMKFHWLEHVLGPNVLKSWEAGVTCGIVSSKFQKLDQPIPGTMGPPSSIQNPSPPINKISPEEE